MRTAVCVLFAVLMGAVPWSPLAAGVIGGVGIIAAIIAAVVAAGAADVQARPFELKADIAWNAYRARYGDEPPRANQNTGGGEFAQGVSGAADFVGLFGAIGQITQFAVTAAAHAVGRLIDGRGESPEIREQRRAWVEIGALRAQASAIRSDSGGWTVAMFVILLIAFGIRAGIGSSVPNGNGNSMTGAHSQPAPSPPPQVAPVVRTRQVAGPPRRPPTPPHATISSSVGDWVGLFREQFAKGTSVAEKDCLRLTKLYAGASVEVLGTGGSNWLYVSDVASGEVGFVSREKVDRY